MGAMGWAAEAGQMDPSARIAPPVKSKRRLANSGSIMPKIHPPPRGEGRVGALHQGETTMEGSGTRRKPAAQAPPRKALQGEFGKLVASQATAARPNTPRPSAAQVTK